MSGPTGDRADGRPGGVVGWLFSRPDGWMLTRVFWGLIAVTLVVLAGDFRELAAARPAAVWDEREVPGMQPAVPYLPSTRRDVEPEPADRRAAPGVRSTEQLRQEITFELVGEGRLIAEGTIHPGAAERFAAEIGKRGSYVKTVVLNSPGGSVRDALAMGRLIRERGLDTAVEAGGYCASSCPLVFSGGVARRAAADAVIGVHQVYAVAQQGGMLDMAGGMDQAQRVSAECQRHLVDMGIDPRVWIHAMETPKERLFYFKPAELEDLKLATEVAGRRQETAGL